MVKISIDLPIPLICLTDQQQSPLQTTVVTAQEAQFCLSLAILLLFYGYLFYLYIVALRTIHSQGVFHELDLLDVSLCVISIIRLCILFVFPLIDHQSGMIWFNIFGFLWIFAIFVVYIRFVVEQRRRWIQITITMALIYIIYTILFNILHKENDHFCQRNWNCHQNESFILPFFLPSIILIILITGIGIREFLEIEKALKQRVLTPSIIIQLKNRRSFIFQTAITCLVSLLMRTFPNIFKPILGEVLYFLFCQWINMAIFYRCVLHRIVRNHEEADSSISEDDRLERSKRNSKLIVIQMQEFNTK